MSNEIVLASAILRDLGDNLKEEESSKLCSDEAFRTLERVLDQYRDVLGQIPRVIGNNARRFSNYCGLVLKSIALILVHP